MAQGAQTPLLVRLPSLALSNRSDRPRGSVLPCHALLVANRRRRLPRGAKAAEDVPTSITLVAASRLRRCRGLVSSAGRPTRGNAAVATLAAGAWCPRLARGHPPAAARTGLAAVAVSRPTSARGRRAIVAAGPVRRRSTSSSGSRRRPARLAASRPGPNRSCRRALLAAG